MTTPRPTLIICSNCKSGLRRQYLNCAGCETALVVWLCDCPRTVLPSRCQMCLSARLGELLQEVFDNAAYDVLDAYGEAFYGEACSLIEEAKDAAERRAKACRR